MKKNTFPNLGNLDLYKTFRINGDRSATELVSDFNRFMITVKYVGFTERTVLNIISTFERYRREFEKANADGKDEIIGYIETVIPKIRAQRYLPPKYNETEYKHHRDDRLKRGDTKSLEILDAIFSVHPLEGGKPVSAPANTNIPTPVNTNTPTPKNTKNTIGGSGIHWHWIGNSDGLEKHIYVLNRFMEACKDIPLHTDFKEDIVIEVLDKIKLGALKSGAEDAKAFAGHIQDIQEKLKSLNGTNLYGEFKEHEKTALSNFKYRLRMADTQDDLKTLIYEFEVFRLAYRDPKTTFEYGELHRQMKSKLESHEESAVSCQESQSDILTYCQAQG